MPVTVSKNKPITNCFPSCESIFFAAHTLHVPRTCMDRNVLLKGVSGGGSTAPLDVMAQLQIARTWYHCILRMKMPFCGCLRKHQFFKPFRRENSSADPPAQVFQRSPLDITWILTYREFVDMSYHGRLFPCSVSVANNST